MKDKINACYCECAIIPILGKDEKHEQDIYSQQLSLFDESNYWCEYGNINWKKCEGVINTTSPNCEQWKSRFCPKFKDCLEREKG